ncbi:MAG: putative ATPase [Alphaproteobacteria bacterium]
MRQLSVSAAQQLSFNTQYDAQELHDITGGNPFFVTALLANNESNSKLVPASILDALGARISNLIDAERSLLQLLSLIPYSIPVVLIEHVFGE